MGGLGGGGKKRKRAAAEVVHWAQCEACEKWRILDAAMGEFESFRCTDKGRSCAEAEDELPEGHQDGEGIGGGVRLDAAAAAAAAEAAAAEAAALASHNAGVGVPIYKTILPNETPATIAALLGISVSDLVRRNNAATGGRLHMLFQSSKMYKGTVLILPASAVSAGSATGYGEGAMYVTARDGETIREIVGLLGAGGDGGVDAGDAVKRMVKMNKGRLRGLNSKSKLLKGTEVLLPGWRGGKGARVGAGKSMRFMKFENGEGKGS